MNSAALPRSFLHATLIAALCTLSLAAPARGASTPPTYVFGHLAGPLGGPGNVDGKGPDARFHNPEALALDAAGNLYVADKDNNTIRKITPDGTVTTLAGIAGDEGSADGTGPAAQFRFPTGVAVDAAGNVYVADSGNHTIRKITPVGVVTTLAGAAGMPGSDDGTGAAARFYHPSGVALDNSGNVLVADLSNNTIRKVTPDGVVTTLTGHARGPGHDDGTLAEATFGYVSSLAVDKAGNIYVADFTSYTIRKITPAGLVTTLAGKFLDHGITDGPGVDARFAWPFGVTVDGTGTVYVADMANHTIRKITPDGIVSTVAGGAQQPGYADGLGAAARFYNPWGLTVDNHGQLFVCDSYNHVIRKIAADGTVTTLAGLAGSSGRTDGTGIDARLDTPLSAAADQAGNVYVADQNNCVVRKITPAGVVSTFAGKMGERGSADGTGSEARFDSPLGVAVDRDGNVYVTDTGSHTVRKISPKGTVTTLAGLAGARGFENGPGSIARFYFPRGIVVDAVGRIFVADSQNQLIRRITPAGEVTTLTGRLGVTGFIDGGPGVGTLADPDCLAINSAGDLFLTQQNSIAIRKITPAGYVTTFAMLPLQVNGANFNPPFCIAIDSGGKIYLSSSSVSTILLLDPDGTISVVAGAWRKNSSTDGLGIKARFNSPTGIAFDQKDNLYVADTANNSIRKAQLGGPPAITTQPASQAVTAGDSVQFSVAAGGVPAPTYQWYVNGSAFNGATSATLKFTNARSSDAGDYTVVVTNELGSVTSNKATLTVSASSPSPPSSPGPGSAGGGGGGAFSWWFVTALALLGGARRWRAR